MSINEGFSKEQVLEKINNGNLEGLTYYVENGSKIEFEDDGVYIDLSDMDLVEFPLGLLEIKNLMYLNLHNNYIKEIPEEISKLNLLMTLDISDNCIENLPSGLFDLEMLSGLHLSFNKIKSIPRKISKLQSLQVLDLRYNRITTVPKSILSLHSLEELYLCNNRIHKIPAGLNDITYLPYLRHLSLEFNLIENAWIKLSNRIEDMPCDVIKGKIIDRITYDKSNKYVENYHYYLYRKSDRKYGKYFYSYVFDDFFTKGYEENKEIYKKSVSC